MALDFSQEKENLIFSLTLIFEVAVTGKSNLVNNELRCIESPVKHLRWNALRKWLTVSFKYLTGF